jgi:hypothetical protein
MQHSLLLSALLAAALALPACERAVQPASPSEAADAPAGADLAEDAGPDLPVRPESTEAGAVIDWEAARRDFAARPVDEQGSNFQVASGGEAPPVPVFLPANPVAAQSGEGTVRFQPTSDGYYAFFPGEAYDTIVNGTNVVITAPGEAVAPRTDEYRYQPTTTGASVSFSKYGADYLVEYECKLITSGTPDCITEDEALAFARDLAISGTR